MHHGLKKRRREKKKLDYRELFRFAKTALIKTDGDIHEPPRQVPELKMNSMCGLVILVIIEHFLL